MKIHGFSQYLSSFFRFPMGPICTAAFHLVRRRTGFYSQVWQLIFVKPYRNLMLETYILSQIWLKLASRVTTIENQGEKQSDAIYLVSPTNWIKIQQLTYEH